MAPRLTLTGREVHLWIVDLADSLASVEACLATLSLDERERAARFRLDRLRSNFILARGVLRALLGGYLGMDAVAVSFSYGARGKPQLVLADRPLDFNVTHSGTFAAYAFTRGCDIGVDIEQMRTMSDEEAIVRRFFSPEECEEWLALDPSLREEGFFRCWTGKESYIKAIGDGLAVPLDSFRVSLRPDSPAALLHIGGDYAEGAKWALSYLRPAAGYALTVAVPERGRDIRVWKLNATSLLAQLADNNTYARSHPIPNPNRSRRQ